MLFGASVYAFSIILAVFLTALGIGSSRASALSRWSTNPRRDLGICQALLIAAIAWSAYMTNSSLPYWPINPTLTMHLWHNFQMDIFRCALAIGTGRTALGRKLSVCSGCRSESGSGSGTAGRKRLCGEYYWRHCRSGRIQPHFRLRLRHPASPADVDCDYGCCGSRHPAESATGRNSIARSRRDRRCPRDRFCNHSAGATGRIRGLRAVFCECFVQSSQKQTHRHLFG